MKRMEKLTYRVEITEHNTNQYIRYASLSPNTHKNGVPWEMLYPDKSKGEMPYIDIAIEFSYGISPALLDAAKIRFGLEMNTLASEIAKACNRAVCEGKLIYECIRESEGACAEVNKGFLAKWRVTVRAGNENEYDVIHIPVSMHGKNLPVRQLKL